MRIKISITDSYVICVDESCTSDLVKYIRMLSFITFLDTIMNIRFVCIPPFASLLCKVTPQNRFWMKLSMRSLNIYLCWRIVIWIELTNIFYYFREEFSDIIGVWFHEICLRATQRLIDLQSNEISFIGPEKGY